MVVVAVGAVVVVVEAAAPGDGTVVGMFVVLDAEATVPAAMPLRRMTDAATLRAQRGRRWGEMRWQCLPLRNRLMTHSR